MVTFLIKDCKESFKNLNNLVLSLGALANIVARTKVTSEESKEMYILCEGVLELNNLSIELENEAIRVLSNNIGVDDEWI